MRAVAGGVTALVLVHAPVIVSTAAAEDASFGCKVLLCAAATTPGWSEIPYCVPVMLQLFRQLAHGGSWPSCSEARTSGLGYDPYLPCPSGLTPMRSGASDTPSLVPAADGDLCADTSKPQQSCSSDGADVCQTSYPTVPRAARTEPYYVDLETANGTQRFYFSLRGY